MIYVRSKRQIIMPENTKGGNMKNKFALMWRVAAVVVCVCILQDKVYCSAKAKKWTVTLCPSKCVTYYSDGTKNVSVINTKENLSVKSKKKIKWTTSNKNILRLKPSKNKVVLYTNGKSGKVTVKAKNGKKTLLVCKVTVKIKTYTYHVNVTEK